MNIYIGKLCITEFCKDNIEYIKFKKENLEDGLMNYYFPNIDEDNFMNPSNFENKSIKVNNYYMVKDQENLIGWIYIGGYKREFVISAGIHPNYRKKGYLTLLLSEIKDYLVRNQVVDSIELMIKNNNTGAQKAAKKAKYKYIGKINNYYMYNSKENY